MKHDPEKLLVLFKKSKRVVQAFVEKFQAQHGRKPHGEDLSNAPEYVRVCIKNCKKIKAHMEKLGLSSPEEETSEKPQTSKAPQPSPKPVIKDITNAKIEAKPKKSKIWGAHLNRSHSDATYDRTFSKPKDIPRTISYSGTLSAYILEDLAKNTRKSLKTKSSNGKATYFDTMDDESTLQNLMDATEVTQLPGGEVKVDPLFTFNPELSMDGLSQSAVAKIEEKECEIEALTDAANLKIAKNSTKTEGKSVSVLALGKEAKVTERSFNELNFSGLFPKNDQKRPNEDEDSNDSKKPRLSYESDEDMFADENVDNSNVQEEESELLPFDPKDSYEDEEDKPHNKRKSKPKKLDGLVSNNFVKIDLKKKNYVRGNKKMTGQQYKRQEWKRKVNSKFGKSR